MRRRDALRSALPGSGPRDNAGDAPGAELAGTELVNCLRRARGSYDRASNDSNPAPESARAASPRLRHAARRDSRAVRGRSTEGIKSPFRRAACASGVLSQADSDRRLRFEIRGSLESES